MVATYCRQDWPVTSPDRWTPVCRAVGRSGSCPDWVRMPLWVWGCHLKHLNQRGTKQRERKGWEGRVWGWGAQNMWRHNTTDSNTATQKDKHTTCGQREDVESGWGRKQGSQKTLIKPRLCERSVCRVNSPSHAYAMQKAKAPGRVFYPRTREKRKEIKCVRSWAA